MSMKEILGQHWDITFDTEIIALLNLLFYVLFAEEDRTTEKFMSILEKQVNRNRKICILLTQQEGHTGRISALGFRMEQIEEKELHAEQTSGLQDIFSLYIYIELVN